MWHLFNEVLLAMWKSRVVLLAVTSVVASLLLFNIIPFRENEVPLSMHVLFVYTIALH